MELMQASRQWAARPDDERFTSLTDLDAFCANQRSRSRSTVVSSRALDVRPSAADELKGIEIFGPNGAGYAPSNWAFGQLATLAGAPAAYLRKLPAPIVADAINYGLKYERDIEEVGVLLRKHEGAGMIAAMTGPRYGRIYNHEITGQLVERFGDGVTGDWRVPGEFGRRVDVTKDNTTLYASDRDMFVFLADEVNRIDFPVIGNRHDRRAAQKTGLARGFFMWNSEVGSASFGVAMFLFDFACRNRIVWGAQGYKEIRIRHSVTAPDRWLEEVAPALLAYRNASEEPIKAALAAAQEKKVDDLAAFLKNRNFTKGMAAKLQAVHEAEEGRPVETLWDTVTAMTAHAKSITFQDERVALEREAGKILDLAL
jgi:hypothetical protein